MLQTRDHRSQRQRLPIIRITKQAESTGSCITNLPLTLEPTAYKTTIEQIFINSAILQNHVCATFNLLTTKLTSAYPRLTAQVSTTRHRLFEIPLNLVSSEYTEQICRTNLSVNDEIHRCNSIEENKENRLDLLLNLQDYAGDDIRSQSKCNFPYVYSNCVEPALRKIE